MRRAASLLFIIPTLAVAASTYAVKAIPAPSGFTNVNMVGINNSGQVAGTGNNGTGSQAFIGSPQGSIAVPLPLGWTSAYGLAINSTGQITGYGYGPSEQAFLGTTSGSTAIPLPPGWTASSGNAVNDSGQVVGTLSNNSSFFTKAFIGTTSGSSEVLFPPGHGSTGGGGVNNSGQIAGGTFDAPIVAFIATAAGTTLLPLPSGWTVESAMGINDSGQVTGMVYGTASQQAYVGTPAAVTVIPLPPGATFANTNLGAINNQGSVVGSSDVGGWIWDPMRGTILLNSLVPTGWNVTVAVSISNNGLILALASENGGPSEYVELVPSACGFSLTPSSLSPSASGGTSSIAIGIATGCSWQAVSNDTWLTITSGSVGLGPGTVNFMIDPNPSLFARVGTLTVAGQTFTVTQLPPPPGAPTLASPANGAGPVSLMPVLSWSAPAGAVSYDVYLGTTNPPALATNVTVNSYTPAALAQGQTYYWQIVATNSGGSASSPVWTFTTVVPTFSKYNVSVIPPPSGVSVISMAGINDSGQVGGLGYKTSGGYVAFDGSPSGSTVLPFNLVEAVFGINESGQVAGYCCNLGGGGYAYIAGATGGTQIPLPSGYMQSEGYGVNNAGQVGGSVLTASTEQAFIGTSSGLTPLPLPSGCTSAEGWAVNNLGQVLEKCVTQLFIGTPEATTALPPMPEAQIYPYAINDLGQIAGYYDNGGSNAFFATASAVTVIPASPNATVYYGALNNAGTVVGTTANGGAWIWDPINGIAYLNNLVPVGWSIGNAVSISNSGLILASGSYQNGPFEWLELSPAPTTAGCSFSLNPWNATFAASAASSSVTVMVGSGCGWTASSSTSWLKITSGTSGTGPGTISFGVPTNIGSARAATITVAGLTFTVTQAVALSAPTLTAPANGSQGVSLTPTLSWTVAAGASSYDVYLGTSPTPGFASNIAGTSYQPAILLPNQTYYWQIVAKNSDGTNPSAVWSFTTAAVAPVGVSPASGSGVTQTFTFTFTDALGYADLYVLDVLVSTFLDGQTACYFALAPTGATTGYLYLVDDAGDGGYAPGSPMPLPSSNSVGNSQCTLNGTGSSISASGNTLTVTLSITFNPSFVGNKAFYTAARSKTQNSGWQALGTWNVPGAAPIGPAVGVVTPARSTSSGQTYTFTFTDTNGFSDLFVLDILTNSFLDGISACYIAYVPTTPTNGYVYLVDDAGDGGYAPGSPVGLSSGSVLQNSQCAINTAASSASASGNTLTLNLALTFKAGFAGNQVVYMAARNSSTGNSGWQAAGSVTVP